MKNIYDERKEDKLLFILDESISTEADCNDVGIFINLYYIDKVDKYIEYINRIQDCIDIYIFTSNHEVYDYLNKLELDREYKIILKENRGRDISALLVAAKKYISQYRYFCFVHDKSPNYKHLTNDIAIWENNLWDNVIASNAYIENVIKLFMDRNELGLLVPSEPYGEYYSCWYGDTWGLAYELTVELADKLKLRADIVKEKPVYTLGTVFWARREALDKLLQYGWRYEDFQDEPLPIDGTLSHAIEHIIGYVAQDAGYKTGTIMTKKYASYLLLNAQEGMRDMFLQLQKREHVFNLHQIRNIDDRERAIKELCDSCEKIYIYGAGNYGVNMAEYLEDKNLQFEGYLVSNGRKNKTQEGGKAVFELDEIANLTDKHDIGIIISVSYEYRAEVEDTLIQNGFSRYIYGY